MKNRNQHDEWRVHNSAWKNEERCLEKCNCVILIGIPEKRSGKRGGYSEVQREEKGNISIAEEEDQERPAQFERPDGAAPAEDPRLK